MSNITQLAPEGDGYRAEYDWKTYRFLLSNGATLDVEAVADTSWLRTEVLKIANDRAQLPKTTDLAVTINGVAEIHPTSTTRRPEKLPARKPARKAT